MAGRLLSRRRFALLGFVALLFTLVAASSAGAVTLVSQPSATIRPGTAIEDVVALGSDNAVYYKSFDGSTWRPWVSLGGPAIGRPTVISYGSGHVDVYARDINRRLMHRWWDGSTWRAWEPVGGAWQLQGDAALVSWAPGRLDAFARGDDGSLIHAYFAGAGWSSWETLGGVITTDPTPISLHAGHLDIYALGSNGLLYHRYFENGWHNWEQLTAWQYTSRPSVSLFQNSTSANMDVFARGTDGTLDNVYWSNLAGWSGPRTFGGGVKGAPSAVSMGPGNANVFVRGTDDRLYYRWYDPSGGWRDWTVLGDWYLAGEPTAVADGNHVGVYAIGADGTLLHKAFYAGYWHNWETLGVPYMTSYSYGGANHAVDTADEIEAVLAALNPADDATYDALWAGLSPDDQARMNVRLADDGNDDAPPFSGPTLPGDAASLNFLDVDGQETAHASAILPGAEHQSQPCGPGVSYGDGAILSVQTSSSRSVSWGWRLMETRVAAIKARNPLFQVTFTNKSYVNGRFIGGPGPHTVDPLYTYHAHIKRYNLNGRARSLIFGDKIHIENWVSGTDSRTSVLGHLDFYCTVKLA